MNAPKCTCPHVETIRGPRRSGWSKDCPVNHAAESLTYVADALVGASPAQNAAWINNPVNRVMSDTSFPPTSAEINALPANLRRWIHDLETNADPAGTVRQAVLVEQENAQLRAALAERDDDAEKWRALMKCRRSIVGGARVDDDSTPYAHLCVNLWTGEPDDLPLDGDWGHFEKFMAKAVRNAKP